MITAHCRLVSALMFECECKCNQRPCNWIKQLRTIAKRVYAAVAAAAQGDRSLSCASMSLNSAPCCGRVYYDVSKGTSRGKTIRTCICRLRVPRVERAWVLHGIAETGICRDAHLQLRLRRGIFCKPYEAIEKRHMGSACSAAAGAPM